MQQRAFGATGLTVSVLGLGAGHIGSADVEDSRAGAVLAGALDAGLTLIDTARGYGMSEERIARHVGHRRAEFVLVTKVGYDVPGAEDWSAAAVTGGVDRALRELDTDVLDVALLHSCPLDVLVRGDAVEALLAARDAGKVRVPGYSGENEALDWAVRSGFFGAVETSVNLVDQHSLRGPLAEAAAAGLGVIAKRPLANASWRFADRPVGDYAEQYWERLSELGIEPADGDWGATALRFSAYAVGVAAAIVGTASLEHLAAAVAAAEQGPLPAEESRRWRAAFEPYAPSWPGLV